MISSRELKRQFLVDERQRLLKREELARSIVADVLWEEFGRRLYRLKPEDEHRLLILFNWREKHHVPVSWMLKILLDIWPKKFARYKERIALGCTVAVLIGQKSEEIIRERADKEFRSKENEIEARQRYRQRIEKRIAVLSGRKQQEKAVTYKSVLDAPSPEEFFRHYGRELRKWKRSESLTDDALQELLRVKRMPFRENPFR